MHMYLHVGVVEVEIYESLVSKKSYAAVVGLGYVGLPLAVALAEKIQVIGYDNNPEKIAMLQSGIDVTGEVGSQALKETTALFTSDAKKL